MKLEEHRDRHARWCVFTSAGDFHNVKAWGWSKWTRKWDLITAFYGDQDQVFDRLQKKSTLAFKSKGSKFQNLKKLFEERPDIFARYDFVLVADDDLHMNSYKINRLFEIAEAYDFWVSQPAFRCTGRISHPITAQAGTKIRITNFVEITCPLFRRDKLVEFLKVYDGNLVGWGIDWWYCSHFGASQNRKLAIIDEVSVINPHDHQRPGKTREIEKLQPSAIRKAQWEETANNLGLAEYAHRNLEYLNGHKPRMYSILTALMDRVTDRLSRLIPRRFR